MVLSNTRRGGTPAHCLRSARPAEAATNFERPFTPRTSLRSARNFRNARFRRFANFDFLTSIFFFWIFCFVFFVFGFSSFSVDFRGARLFLTSKSSSSRFFALDGQIFRSVRRLGLIFRLFTIRTSTFGGKAWVTEIPGGRSPPESPRGARHG